LTECKRRCHTVERTIIVSHRQEEQVPEVLTATEAAAYLQVPVETLRRWRSIGSGPRHAKVGRHVRYRRAALDRWFEEREREAAGGAR
jgi:excisionase family DNA binding protein